MTPVYHSGAFRRDLKLAHRRGKDLVKLQDILERLSRGEPLPARLRDHPLKGDMQGCRECHIEPDWLLIYRLEQDGGAIRLERTGTHSDLFG